MSATAASSMRPVGIGALALGLAVVMVWGSNFVVIKLALEHLPPFALATLRYAFAVLPAVLFVRRPAVPWSTLAKYGLAIGVGQFGLLFLSMSDLGRGAGSVATGHSVGHAGGWISPAMASLVVQIQVFFTLGLAVLFRGDRVSGAQLAGLGVSLAGLALIGWQALAGAGEAQAPVTGIGLALVLGAALCWALGNWVVMGTSKVDMLAFVVWSSLFAVPPLAVLSLAIEGWPRVSQGLASATVVTWAAVVWQAVGNTLFGYAAWGWLLSRHAAASVTPLALLVPVFGMASSAWWLGEPMPGWKLAAAAAVVAGLAVSLGAGIRRSTPNPGGTR